MILVTVSGAIFIYLMIALTVIIAAWIISEYKTRTKATQVEPESTMKCSICLETFIYDRNEKTARCTHCNTLNDVLPHK